jgi:hypothetical protein
VRAPAMNGHQLDLTAHGVVGAGPRVHIQGGVAAPTYSSSRLRRARRRCMYRTPTISAATTKPIVVVSIAFSILPVVLS